MLHKRYGWPALAVLLGAATSLLFAEPPPEEPPSEPPRLARKEDEKKAAQPAVKADGPVVHLTREEYQKLLDEIARLKGKPFPVSICHVTGKIDGDLAVLAATFDFKTTTPNAVVALACPPPAQPTGVVLRPVKDGQIQEGHVPLFKSEAGGCSVQVEKSGEYKLTLDLLVALTTKGAERGFELELPGAAITNLDLALPDNARDVRIGGLAPPPDVRLKDGHLVGPLGRVEKLDVKWRKPGAPNTPPVLTATARITVQLDDRETRTRAELALKSEGGPASEWRLVVPAKATVKLASKEDEARVQSMKSADHQKVAEQWTIRLKEPVGELNVVVTVAGPPPRAGALVPVGPFLLQTALRQSGRITVEKSGLQDVKLDYHRHGDVEAAPGAADEFRYAAVTIPDKPQGTTGPASLSLLDVEPRSTRGLVETRVVHVLTLRRDDARGRVWRLKTTIEATPFGIGVDHLDVQLPAECQYAENVGDPAEFDAATRLLHFKVPANKFTRMFEAEYKLDAAGEAGRATLALPRPLDTRDRGPHEVRVVTQEDEELLPPETPPAAYDPETQEPQLHVWRARRIPENVPVAWRPYQPEVRASCEIDLTLKGREGHVRQVFRFHYTRPPAAPQVMLRFPTAITDRWNIVSGGAAGQAANNLPVRPVKLDPADKERGHTLVLEYTFPLGDDADALGVPLVTPEQVTAGPSKVRVWSEAGAVPALGDGLWATADIEAVAEQPRRLPVLVARAARLDAPLTLQFGQDRAAAPAAVLVDRVLVRVDVGDDGVQAYRVKYLLTQLAARPLLVELPAPVPSLNLRVTFDGEQVTPQAVDESGKPADGGRFAQLALPPRPRKTAVLEVSYQLQAVRTGSGAWQTTLQPPALRGDPGRPPTRWQVTLADGPNLAVLWPDGGPGAEPVWGRRGWLFGPKLAVTAGDLERWFAGDRDLPGEGDDPSRPVTATCWRQGAEPVTVIHLPQRTWLLTCSLVFLVGCLSLFLLARHSDGTQTTVAGWFWVFLALLPVAVMVGLFLYPTPAAAVVFGCLPGALVVLLVILFHLILQERQRRQLVFLPSFRRGGGSSMTGALKSSAARRGEPSTVDVPQPNGSPWPTGEVLQPEGSSGGKAG